MSMSDIARGYGRDIANAEMLERRYLAYAAEQRARADAARQAAHGIRRTMREWAMTDALNAIGAGHLAVRS